MRFLLQRRTGCSALHPLQRSVLAFYWQSVSQPRLHGCVVNSCVSASSLKKGTTW